MLLANVSVVRDVLQAERKHRSHEAEVQAYQHDWKQHVLRLKNYFERQGLQNVDPSTGELDTTPMVQAIPASMPY